MDEVNIPRTFGDTGWPPQPPRQPVRAPERPGEGATGNIRERRRGTKARWAISLGAAAVMVGASVLGVALSGGSGGGAAQAAGFVLTGKAASPLGGNGQDVGVASGASGFATSWGGRHGAAARAARARFHACIASARRMRATGHGGAARTRLHACVREFRRLRAAMIGSVRAREARLAELLRRAMHGQVTVASKSGPKTVAFERGIVQSISGSSVVIKAVDGVTWTWRTGSETRVYRDGRKVSADALAAGQRVAVLGQVVGGTDQARRVLIGDHAAGR